MSDPRDDLAALITLILGRTATSAARAIIAAGWKPPGTTFDVCGHGRRRTESCFLCERTIP